MKVKLKINKKAHHFYSIKIKDYEPISLEHAPKIVFGILTLFLISFSYSIGHTEYQINNTSTTENNVYIF